MFPAAHLVFFTLAWNLLALLQCEAQLNIIHFTHLGTFVPSSLGVIMGTDAMATACTTGHHSTVDMGMPHRFPTQTCMPRPMEPTLTTATSS